jgi:hypothetical protein
MHIETKGVFGTKERKLRKSMNEFKIKLVQIYLSIFVILFPPTFFLENKHTIKETVFASKF